MILSWARRILITLEEFGRTQNSPVTSTGRLSINYCDTLVPLVNISAKNKKYLSFKGSLFFILFQKVCTALSRVAATDCISTNWCDRTILLVPRPRFSSFFLHGQILPSRRRACWPSDEVLRHLLIQHCMTSSRSTVSGLQEVLHGDGKE